MRFQASVCVALLLVAGPAVAGESVGKGPPPAWVVPSELLPVPKDASGLVFVRRQDTLVHLDAKGQSTHLGYRIAILHPTALQLGNLAVEWNPSAGDATVHTLKVHRGAEVIDLLPTASFEVLRREEGLEAAMLSGVRTATLRIPDLRVGDELELAYTVRQVDPTLGNKSFGALAVLPETAPGRFRLGIGWTPGEKPRIAPTADVAPRLTNRADGLDVTFDNPEPLAFPDDVPVRYRWMRGIEFSDFADWAAVSRLFASLYTDAARLPQGSPLKTEAARIAAAHATPYDRAAAALKLVQQDVRYIYVGLDGGNLKPATAEETWQRRYGDCKGKTALLLALLGELGIPAEAVLVNTRGIDDGLDRLLPGPGHFDHVLVRAHIDGRSWWMDGTLPPVATPSETPVLPFRRVLPVSEEGKGLEALTWKPARPPRELALYEIDARQGFDKPARITSTAIVRGMKALEQQVAFSAVPKAQLTNLLREKLLGGTWQTIEEVTWRFDGPTQASILTIVGTGAPDWDVDDDGSRSMALPGGGFNPPDKRVRSGVHATDVPFANTDSFSCHVTSVRIPADTSERQWSHAAGFETRMFGRLYFRAFEVRDGVIRMVRSSRVEQLEFDAAAAERDNQRIVDFNNSMGMIYFEPKGRETHAKSARSVPATFDVDWVNVDTACLPGAS